MSDLDRIEKAKRKADETAFQKGYRQGIDESLFGIFFVGLGVYILLQWLP